MEPFIKKSGFWADGINGFLLRKPYREPAPKPEVKARQSHPDFPNGSRVLLNSPLRPIWSGRYGTVDAYWPLAAGGPCFGVIVDYKEDTRPAFFTYGELTHVPERD